MCTKTFIAHLLYFGIAEYEIVTRTGDRLGAGTDANVFVTLYGEFGVTPRLHLYSTDSDGPMERGETDSYLLRSKDVGKMKKLRYCSRGGSSECF